MRAEWLTNPDTHEVGYWHVLNCEVCHEKFYSKRSDARFDSDRCRQFAHRALERQRAARAELQEMGRRVNRIAETYADSQDMLDELGMLRESIDRAIKQFDVQWQPQQLPMHND